MTPACPLCASSDYYDFSCRSKVYSRCQTCDLVWLQRNQLLSEPAEKAIYDTHQNQLDDPGYRQFLSRSLNQVIEHIAPPAQGLDFGCGPGPALIKMAVELGYQMQAYDKFYADHPEVLNQTYDFITCTEVVEHLVDPLPILDQLWSITRPGGLLVIQTKRVLDDERFCNWHYRNDPTHISFFSETSFRWLAQHWQTQIGFPHNDVVIFKKA